MPEFQVIKNSELCKKEQYRFYQQKQFILKSMKQLASLYNYIFNFSYLSGKCTPVSRKEKE